MWSERSLLDQYPGERVATLLNRAVRHAVAAFVVIEAGLGVRADGPLTERVLIAATIGVIFAVIASLGDLLPFPPSLVVSALMVPATLLLIVPISGQLDWSYALTGWWPVIIASAAIITVGYQAGRVAEEVIERTEPVVQAIAFAGFLLTIVGLWLAQAWIGGVRLSGDGGDKLATVIVLASFLRLGLSTSWPLQVITYGVKLWILCWLSAWMAATLRTNGFWPFLLAVLFVSGVTLPYWLFETWWRRRQAMEDAMWAQQEMMAAHQRAVMDMTMMSAMNAAHWRRRF
jgi:hypothetical protein